VIKQMVEINIGETELTSLASNIGNRPSFLFSYFLQMRVNRH